MKGALIVFFIFCYSCFQGQTFQWLQKQTFSESTYGYGIETDAVGNVYTGGKFEPHYHGTTSTGIFVSKYDSNGNLQWTDTSNTRYIDFLSITADQFGATYVLVNIGSSVTLDSIDITFIDPYYNTLLIKYNTDGHVEWVKQLSQCEGKVIAADKFGAVYMTGYRFSTLDFGNGHVLSGSGSCFAKYDSSGNSIWANNITGSISPMIAYDKDSSIYIRAGGIRRYNLDGILQSTSSLPGGKFAADKNGNLYLTGWFTSSTTFGSTTLYSPSSDGAAFLAKRNVAGQYEWAVSPTSINYINLCLDPEGGLFVTSGSGYGYDPGTGFVLTKYDTANGTALWNYSYITRLAGAYPYSDGTGNIYMAGGFYDAPNEKSMVLKISESSVIGIQELSEHESFSVYPNPSSQNITISFNGRVTPAYLKISNTLGQVVYSEKIKSAGVSEDVDVSRFQKGIYFVELNGNRNRQVKKLVVN